MRKFIFLLCLLPFFAIAEEEILSDPQAVQGILFVGHWDQVRSKLSHPVHAVISQRVALLDKNQGFLNRLANRYLGRSATQELLEDLQSRVADFYRGENQPFAVISIPRQTLSSGVLQVVVEEAKVGRIVTQGNQHALPSQLTRFIRAKPGEALDVRQLAQDLARINRNPFRRTDVMLRAGKKPELTDLELLTVDRWPYRIYMGGDNTGTAATDRDRLFFGFNFGKTLIQDSAISYQFTCSPNWNLFYAHTASCRIPCPKRQTLILFGGYSQTEPKLDRSREKGVSWQVDGRYRFPLMTDSRFLQELLLGYDFKQVSSRITSDGEADFQGDADINQFMVGYDVSQRDKLHRVSFIAELYGNPGGITTRNKTADYEKFRSHAHAAYAYLKVSHSLACQLNPSFWFTYDINGQIATSNLLPSEQLTLTGSSAVRGFEERVVNVDNGLLISTSLQTSRYSLGKSFGITKKALDELYFLLFFDCGLGVPCHKAASENSFVNLGSVGPGIRYQIDRWFTARFDYGWQLWHNGFKNPSDSRYNFGLIMSY